MKTLLPLILCLLLTACAKPTVSFFGVPIEGTLDAFYNMSANFRLRLQNYYIFLNCARVV